MDAPGLYIHIPFCRGKCPYCDFYSINAPADSRASYCRALIKEAELYSGMGSKEFSTLHLGGGTPSLLEAEEIEIVSSALAHFPFSTTKEFTLEANPDDVTAEKLDLWAALGVNRISLGVQSFDDKRLAWLGRRHDGPGAALAATRIKTDGRFHLSLDLMFGLPDQTINDWEKELRQAIGLTPQHLSCYQLTLEPGTRLVKTIETGDRTLPSENLGRELFLFTDAFLTSLGYQHYEISNYSLGPSSRSMHNMKYWRRTPYLGLGPSAHSFDGRNRWWNKRSVKAYISDIESGCAPVEDRESLTPEDVLLESVMLGLRTSDGVPKTFALANPEASNIVNRWLSEKLAVSKDQSITLTPQGMALADGLAAELAAVI